MSLLAEYSAHEPDMELISWEAPNKGFKHLPGSAEYLISFGEPNDRGWQHQPIVFDFYGRKWIAHNTAPYDEGQSGSRPLLHVSDDGKNWTEVGFLLPPQSDPSIRVSEGLFGRLAFVSKFLVIDNVLYAFIDINDKQKIAAGNVRRVSIGHMLVSISADGTIGTPFWVRNTDLSQTAPAPFEVGYPTYQYDGSFTQKVQNLLEAPNFYPKLMFGWPEIWRTSEQAFGETMGEPQSIQPRGYRKWWKHYKLKTSNNNRYQIEGFGYPYKSPVPESSNSGVTRLAVYDNKTIIIVGNSAEQNREEGFVAIARQDSLTKKYVVVEEDVYSVTNNQKDTPRIIDGDGKSGGEQLFGIQITEENYLDIVFSVTKEDIYFKTVDLNTLI
jgi:hypothetical protein